MGTRERALDLVGVILGAVPDDAVDLTEVEPQSWIELHVERHERRGHDIAIRELEMDDLSWPEWWHLELFLLARQPSFVTDWWCERMPSLRSTDPDRALAPHHRSYLGSVAPRAILFGDIHNPNGFDDEWPHDAAFSPWAGSGPWLLEAVGVDELRTLGMANANEVDIPALVEAVGTVPLVALGRNAERALHAAGLECAVAPHPAAARRFAAKRQAAYGELVLDLIGSTRDEAGWR